MMKISVLSRYSTVVVTANSRTRSVWCAFKEGLYQSLGLKKGVEVKFQRNAPSVLDHPVGNEADEDNDAVADYSSSGSDISDEDHNFSMGVHTPNKQMFQSSTPSSSAKSINRGTNRNVHSTTWIRKPGVDLSKLGMNSLRRYCQEYNISGINSDSTREQVLRAVEHHFVSQPPLDEVQVIRDLLIHLAKEPKNKNFKQEP
ncbi:uncharacterized protein LOC119989160 isoform X2 [Tripterygium wilfordii]|uniref:uncharacterized protein LOC119989160 isoform X2 n=1 Tax=Tripterygium wilfordii TaxID=458696 RepID=UPI0018F854CA|nr:uncharacterized protein LOC119989160 isoform X2 [Tripterygium wilfordii]